MPETQVTLQSFRDRLNGSDLFLQAVSQSDLRPIQKLFVRGAYRVPGMREDIDNFIEAKLSESGDVNAMANGEIIKYIIEHLPEIAAFIMTLFKLFGGLGAMLLPLLQVMTCLAVFFLPSIVSAQAVYRGRNYSAPVCSSPNCAMCNYIRAQLQPTAATVETRPVTTTPSDVQYETVQVPYQTKVCNNGVCSYEIRFRTERRPILNAIKAVRDVIDDATPRIDLLRVTDLVPTPQDAVVEMLSLAAPKPNEVLYDLGCGDGRVLIAASSGYGCRAVGVELNRESFKQAAELVDGFGLADKIRIYQGDVLSYSYPQADIVTMYLYPELMAKVIQHLRPGTRVVSYLHPIPGGKKYVVRNHTFYTWTVE